MAIDPTIDLRAMVREVLRETVATPAGAQVVTLRNDADLQAFVARLSAPGVIEAVRAGTVKFTLGAGTSIPAAQASGVVLEGVVSERKLVAFAPGATVVLAASAVLTPMARDAGRRLALKFERMTK